MSENSRNGLNKKKRKTRLSEKSKNALRKLPILCGNCCKTLRSSEELLNVLKMASTSEDTWTTALVADSYRDLAAAATLLGYIKKTLP